MSDYVYDYLVFGVSFLGFSQEVNTGEIHGDFDLNLQSYQEDELIGATAADAQFPLTWRKLDRGWLSHFLLGAREARQHLDGSS